MLFWLGLVQFKVVGHRIYGLRTSPTFRWRFQADSMVGWSPAKLAGFPKLFSSATVFLDLKRTRDRWRLLPASVRHRSMMSSILQETSMKSAMDLSSDTSTGQGMATAPNIEEMCHSERQNPLAAIRSRSLLVTKYIFWALSFAFLLLIGNAYSSLVQRWLALLERTRLLLGIQHPASGPDWFLLLGLAFGFALPVVAGVFLYWV